MRLDSVHPLITLIPSYNAYNMPDATPTDAVSRNLRLSRLPHRNFLLLPPHAIVLLHALPLLPRPPHPSPFLLLPPLPLPLFQPLFQRRHRRPRLNRVSKRRDDLRHDVADVLGDAPAGLDGYDVAEAQGGARVVD